MSIPVDAYSAVELNGSFLKWGGKSFLFDSAVRVRRFWIRDDIFVYESQARGNRGRQVRISLDSDVGRVDPIRFASHREASYSMRAPGSPDRKSRSATRRCFDIHVLVRGRPTDGDRFRKLTIFASCDSASTDIEELHALLASGHRNRNSGKSSTESSNLEQVLEHNDRENCIDFSQKNTPSPEAHFSDWTTDDDDYALSDASPYRNSSPRKHSRLAETLERGARMLTRKSSTEVDEANGERRSFAGKCAHAAVQGASVAAHGARNLMHSPRRHSHSISHSQFQKLLGAGASVKQFLARQCASHGDYEELTNDSSKDWRHAEIKIVSANGLMDTDVDKHGNSQPSDPYCKVRVRWGPKPQMVTIVETHTLVKTSSPQWNERPFDMVVQHVFEDCYHNENEPFLLIQIYDRDASEHNDDFLGEAMIQFPPWYLGLEQDEVHDYNLPLTASRQKFAEIDTNGDGQLSILELKEAVRKGIISKDDVDRGEVLLQITWSPHSKTRRVPPHIELAEADFPVVSIESEKVGAKDMEVHGTEAETEDFEAKGVGDADNAPANGTYWRTEKMNDDKPVYYNPKGFAIAYSDKSETNKEGGWWICALPVDRIEKDFGHAGSGTGTTSPFRLSSEASMMQTSFCAFNPDHQAQEPCDCSKKWQNANGLWLSVQVSRAKPEVVLDLPKDWEEKTKKMEQTLREEVRQAINYSHEMPPALPLVTDTCGIMASMSLCFFLGRMTHWLWNMPLLVMLLLLVSPACILSAHVFAALSFRRFWSNKTASCGGCGQTVTHFRKCRKCGKLHCEESHVYLTLRDKFPDFQRAAYFASFLSFIWPQIVAATEPKLQGRWWRLNLGFRPPLILSVKVYDGFPTILDFELCWPAGLMLMLGTVNYAVPVLEAVSMEAHLRLKVEDFLPSLPFVGQMSYCFAASPKMHFVWSDNAIGIILRTFFLPILEYALPRILWVKNGWPRWRELHFIDPERLEEAVKGVLFVACMEAQNLCPDRSKWLRNFIHGSRQYYLELRVGSTTKCKMLDEAKSFSSEHLRFEISNPRQKKLILSVWADGKPGRGRMVGRHAIDLAGVVEQKKIERLCTLKQNNHQQKSVCPEDGPWCRMRLCWLPRDRKSSEGLPSSGVNLLVEEAEEPHYLFLHLDLAKNLQNTGGLRSPYCVLDVYEDNHLAIGAQTSRIVANTLNPVWHEDFTFTVQRISHAWLEIQLFDGRKSMLHPMRKAPSLGVARMPINELLRTGESELPLRAMMAEDCSKSGKEQSHNFEQGVVKVGCLLGPVIEKFNLSTASLGSNTGMRPPQSYQHRSTTQSYLFSDNSLPKKNMMHLPHLFHSDHTNGRRTHGETEAASNGRSVKSFPGRLAQNIMHPFSHKTEHRESATTDEIQSDPQHQSRRVSFKTS